ncbi:MAG: MFS transporter [Spirochaetota bacterium]
MKKLSIATKTIFGSADLFGGGALNMVGFYYLIFLTDVVQISPAYAGAIVLASRIWDAVTDPAMGVIVDRTRTRFGKRRPYFMAAVVTVFISMVVLWYPVAWADEVARVLFALFGYLFFSTVSTTVMVPYLSMQPELTSDYNERTSLNVFKMAFSFIASIIAAIVPMTIVRAFADIRTGYLVMGLVFGVFYALPWIGISLHIRERDNRSDPPPPRFSFGDILVPLRIRTFRMLILIYLGAFLTLDVMSSVIAFAMTYLFNRPDDLQTVLGTLIVTQIVFLPFISTLTGRFGKNKVLVATAFVWMAGVAAIAVMPRAVPLPALLGLAVVTGVGVSGCMVIPWTMYPDATDVGMLVTGRDVAGSFGGSMTFFRKLASALALFIVGLVLDLSGYLAPFQETIDGVTQNVIREQPAAALTTIRFLLVGLPLLLLGMAGIVAARYPLTPEVHARLSLHVRRLRGEEVEPLEEADVEALRKTLV